ncbi:MAG: hypothetical protein AB8B91_04830 [Rubripirellula sp.]
MHSFAGQFQMACQGQVDRCFVSSAFFDSEHRLGTVMITRRMSDGRLGCIRFLVDAMCLGVKNVHANFIFPSKLADILEYLGEAEELRPASPATARKLVEDAISFAERLGFDPCAGYQKHASIWGDIDPSECKTTFEFGDQDGKPFFCAGPNETDLDVANIIATLEESVGEDNFGVEADSVYGLDELAMGGGWDDPELDIGIDEDLDESTAQPLIDFPK